MGLANKTTAGDQLKSRLLAVWHLVFRRSVCISTWFPFLLPGTHWFLVAARSAEELYREPHDDDGEEYPEEGRAGGRVTRTTSVIKAAQVRIIATSRWWWDEGWGVGWGWLLLAGWP